MLFLLLVVRGDISDSLFLYSFLFGIRISVLLRSKSRNISSSFCLVAYGTIFIFYIPIQKFIKHRHKRSCGNRFVYNISIRTSCPLVRVSAVLLCLSDSEITFGRVYKDIHKQYGVQFANAVHAKGNTISCNSDLHSV